MAKYKGFSKRPQPKHKKPKQSRHDKRKRLQSRNPRRKKTAKAKVPLTGAMQRAVSVVQAVMDRRIAFRMGALLLHGHLGGSARYLGGRGRALGDRRTLP